MLIHHGHQGSKRTESDIKEATCSISGSCHYSNLSKQAGRQTFWTTPLVPCKRRWGPIVGKRGRIMPIGTSFLSTPICSMWPWTKLRKRCRRPGCSLTVDLTALLSATKICWLIFVLWKVALKWNVMLAIKSSTSRLSGTLKRIINILGLSEHCHYSQFHSRTKTCNSTFRQRQSGLSYYDTAAMGALTFMHCFGAENDGHGVITTK